MSHEWQQEELRGGDDRASNDSVGGTAVGPMGGAAGRTAELPMQSLLAYTRLKPSAGRYWLLLLLLYAPFGVVILAGREAVTICAGLLLATLQHLLSPAAADTASTLVLRAVR